MHLPQHALERSLPGARSALMKTEIIVVSATHMKKLAGEMYDIGSQALMYAPHTKIEHGRGHQ